MVLLGACRYAIKHFVYEREPRLSIAALRGVIDGLLNRTGPIRD